MTFLIARALATSALAALALATTALPALAWGLKCF